MTESGSKIFPETAVKGASTVPAYALVILSLLTLLAVATQASMAIALPVVILVCLLSGYVIWIIEVRARRSVATASPAQAERLAEVRDLDAPVRGVFQELVGEDDVYLVYSSTEVKEFVDQLQETVRPDDDPSYGGLSEKRVTTIPDAIGAGRIRNLLYIGGKREKLHSITSWKDDFRSDYWDKSLILIGSGKSNCITADVFRRFPSPYRFSDDFDAITDVTDATLWPAHPDELRTVDYGLLVKFRVEDGESSRVYLVIAGVGPYGTLAGCRFLERDIKTVYDDFGTSPFAYVLSVERDGVSYFNPKVLRKTALPVVRG